MWYLPFTICNLEPTATHNSSLAPVEMEGCEGVRFKCAIIKFLTEEKIPPIDIHHHMQKVYGAKCVDVSIVRCWIWQYQQEEVKKASLCDKARLGRPVTAIE